MRKKMNRLEEESNQRSALSVDRDDAILTLQVVYQLVDLGYAHRISRIMQTTAVV